MLVDEHNEDFRKAVEIVNHTDQHLFLTGKAGTGKTTFLKYIRENTFKKLAVVAPTGVAAINAGGVTIHSFFQLPIGTYLADQPTGWGRTDHRFYNADYLLSNARMQRTKRELIRELDLIIIDEISMVRADVMDAIDLVLRHIRRRHHEPFGGLQMVFIGDLFQLPPVVREEERENLEHTYESPFFFHSRVIQEAPPIVLELKKIYRQEDSGFIALLNKIRNNKIEPEDLDFLEQYYNPDYMPDGDDGYITLTTHNYIADRINSRELENLYGEEFKIKAKIKNTFPESAFPADETLALKKGAQIMFIRNEKGENRRYFNGKMGIIEEIEPDEEKLLIRFPHEKELLELKQDVWENIRFEYDEAHNRVQEKIIGTFQQFPIRLAWAVTIHKSQGLTFEKAVIDAGKAFAPGQVYVALSRLTNLNGLILKSLINRECIKTDPRVTAYSGTAIEETVLNQLLEESKDIFLKKSILTVFDWEKLLRNFNRQISGLGSKSSLYLTEKGWVSQLKGCLDQQKKMAEKFTGILDRLLTKKEYEKLNERVLSASQWFTAALESELISRLDRSIKDLSSKSRTKKMIRILQDIKKLFLDKITQLDRVKNLTHILSTPEGGDAYLQEAEAIFQSPKAEIATAATPAPAKRVKGSSMQESLAMFKAGKAIPEIARIRELKEGTILNHLIPFIATGELTYPQLFNSPLPSGLITVINQNPEAKSSEIRELTREKYSYSQIKACLLQMRREETSV